ncbi:MAG: hypothetical protein DRI34_13610 [Deltaproteobacteria bacterium]|nr:MAG: hypothetical protein DRI34_13610 [Deltaproteobacteria bacterium]
MGEPKVRTSISLERKKYERLLKIARRRRCSVSTLIRQSLEMTLGLYDAEDRKRAVEEISSLGLPVASWQQMEKEIISGATEQ